jgi:hypothetical protein
MESGSVLMLLMDVLNMTDQEFDNWLSEPEQNIFYSFIRIRIPASSYEQLDKTKLFDKSVEHHSALLTRNELTQLRLENTRKV